MNFKNRNRNYEKLWIIYDYLMQNVRYDIWANYIFYLLKDELPSNPKLLELGAGNCKLANLLKDFFPNIIASDLSKEMLKSDQAGILPKICCDMCSLPIKSKFDLIYSTFDSVNYLTSKKKLLSLFREIYRLMDINSIFTFDASLENNSLKHIQEKWRTGTYLGMEYQHKSEYNNKSRIHKNIFRMKSSDNKLYFETHKQKIYPFETYFELLEKSDLYAAACFESFTYKNAKPDSDRIQFVVKRII